MPSGRTHDLITFSLAPAAFAVTYLADQSVTSASILTSAFLFGGLMFGPDLDTVSRQYSRWSYLRFIWLPYRAVFKHRSRFSHGLIFGAVLRVIYFKAVIAILIVGAVLVWNQVSGLQLPAAADLFTTWLSISGFMRNSFGEYSLLLIFIGLWLGAASHTFTDMAGSFIKTGRVIEYL